MKPKIPGFGIFFIPNVPFVKAVKFIAVIFIISPNPSVIIDKYVPDTLRLGSPSIIPMTPATIIPTRLAAKKLNPCLTTNIELA